VTRAPSRVVRRAFLVALAVGGFLLPWCVLLGITLPATASAQHWSLAWAGLDAAEAAAALATAVLLRRGSPRAGLTAAAGAALLLTDAWFDICTSAPGLDRMLAAGEAIFAEVPLAGAGIWLAITVTCSSAISRS
jgi:LPXTG-motif cell wall-anchored protein